MSQPIHKGWSEFSISEWHRLSEIASKYEPKMRLAYTRAASSGKKLDKLQLQKTVIDVVAETAITSAKVYGLVFNPNSPDYKTTCDALVDGYAATIESPQAQNAVKMILPKDLPLHERRSRLNTFGLDTQSALRVERYRQEIGDAKTAVADVERARKAAIQERGNLVALTEVNRMVNTALETLWLDNLEIAKADVLFFDRSIEGLGSIPRSARKEIITRRDERVCNYCSPLDGETAKIGMKFNTDYGLFDSPPFHPRCRCFMIVSVGR